jgi:hypothetical protein
MQRVFLYLCGKNRFLAQKTQVYVLGKNIKAVIYRQENKAGENNIGNYTIRIFVICFLLLIL